MAGRVQINENALDDLVREKVMAHLRSEGTRKFFRSQALVPVDTGELRASGKLTEKPARLEVEISYDAEHAGYVEFGTSKMAAQPFLRPSMRA